MCWEFGINECWDCRRKKQWWIRVNSSIYFKSELWWWTICFWCGFSFWCVENSNATTSTYSSGDGWWRTMWIILPGGYNGLCSVNAIELSFGCVLAFRAVYLSCEDKSRKNHQFLNEESFQFSIQCSVWERFEKFSSPSNIWH